MGRAPAVLALLAALSVWYALAPGLAPLGTWAGVVIVSLVLMPALFGASLLALPLRSDPRLAAFAAAAIVLSVALSFAPSGIPANFAKFAATTTVGWFFLTFFEELSWVIAVALIIPWIDAYSVWRGPTKAITTHHQAIFSALTVAFVVPGGTSARLGLADVMFFAVFLAASARFGLRPLMSFAAMTACLGVTMVVTTYWATGGLPALPGISLGFLAANCDLLWRRYARRGQPSLERGG